MDKFSLQTIDLGLAVLLRRFSSILTKKYGNLDRSAYLLLHQIRSNGPAGVKALAAEFQLDVSTVSRQAAALEHKGYVFKIPDPSDRRAYSFQITELGKMEFEESQKQRYKRMEEIFKNWSDEEQKLFALLLQKYNHSVLDGQTVYKNDAEDGNSQL